MRPIIIFTFIMFCIACGDEKKTIQTSSQKRQNMNDSLLPSYVITDLVKRTEFRITSEIVGTIKSKQDLLLSTEISGKVKKILSREGMNVKKGELIAKLDDQIIFHSLQEAISAFELAEALFKKQQKLWKDSIGSEIDFLSVKAQYEASKSRMNILKTNLEHTRIIAPFTGIVDQIFVKVGDIISPSVPILRIINMDKAYVEVEVPERYIPSFSLGDIVDISIESKKIKMREKIIFVSKYINPINRSFTAHINISRTFPLLINSSVICVFVSFSKSNQIVIPNNIIQKEGDEHFVFVIGEKDGKPIAEKRTIKIGKTNDNAVLISEGINDQERIITEGFSKIFDGSSIQFDL